MLIPGFSTIHNLRDYGGYATADNARLRAKTLYRSGHLSDADNAELGGIDQLALRAMIDLRSDRERHEHPFRALPNTAYTLYFANGGMQDAPHLSGRFSKMQDASEVRAAMTRFYGQMPFLPECREAFRVYLETLAATDGPSLVHCFAGKDRTGFAVALVHKLLGVHDDDLMADYLKTNDTGEARIEDGVATLRGKHGAQMSDIALREVMMVTPAYLATAFAALDETASGMTGYIREHLKLSPAQIEQLRQNCLA